MLNGFASVFLSHVNGRHNACNIVLMHYFHFSPSNSILSRKTDIDLCFNVWVPIFVAQFVLILFLIMFEEDVWEGVREGTGMSSWKTERILGSKRTSNERVRYSTSRGRALSVSGHRRV